MGNLSSCCHDPMSTAALLTRRCPMCTHRYRTMLETNQRPLELVKYVRCGHTVCQPCYFMHDFRLRDDYEPVCPLCQRGGPRDYVIIDRE